MITAKDSVVATIKAVAGGVDLYIYIYIYIYIYNFNDLISFLFLKSWILSKIYKYFIFKI